jgi:predicted NAD/FAD-binding protein
MSFSVTVDRSGLEYSGAGLSGIFAQRRNALRPGFWGLLREIAHFGRKGRAALDAGTLPPELTMEEFLRAEGLSERFRREYLVPLGSAIWSADPQHFERFPAGALLRFLDNHGLLVFRDRPRWQTIQGGSARYLEAFVASTRATIRTSSPVERLRREPDRVLLSTPAGDEAFDQVVVATHSDQALALLVDPSPAEKEVLGSVRYQANEVVLHTDVRLMPSTRRAWASWNYHQAAATSSLPTVTYWMNRLQSLDAAAALLVTLNRTEAIEPSSILGRYEYHHPIYDVGTFAAQARWAEINGVDRTWFCGAWWGFGFHEDGAASGARVAEAIGP